MVLCRSTPSRVVEPWEYELNHQQGPPETARQTAWMRGASNVFTSSMFSLLTLASFSTYSTGFIVLRNKSMLSSSNLVRVSISEKSLSSSKDSISMRVDCWLDKVRDQ